MKKKMLGLLAMVIMTGTLALAQKTTKMTVEFVFINIEEGYDHVCKTEVSVDGKVVGSSPEVKQSVGAKFSVQVPKDGTHDLLVMNLAKYEGNWEEHTVDNDYSIDCFVQKSGHAFKGKGKKLYIVFDIDTETHASWGKKVKLNKERTQVVQK